MGSPKHSDDFYEQKLAELAPYWEEHLQDGKLLDEILEKINSVNCPGELKRLRDRLAVSALIVLAITLCSGCAAKKIVGAHYLVGQECHASADLYGCDPGNVSPPTGCKKSALHYDKGCEQLVLTK